MHPSSLAKALEGQPGYRTAQARELVFKGLISDWREASSLPMALRLQLMAAAPIASLEVVRESASTAGDTHKAALRLRDGQLIETVLMRHTPSPRLRGTSGDSRNTVCVSSQAGCPMACAFCATGTMGLKRNLTSEEIVDQVLHFARVLKREGEHVTNVVLMGMGEPFHNYDGVLEALRILNDPDGFGFGARRMSISTCGIVPGILRLADEPLQANLAISLHAPTDDLRSKLMPVNRAYPIARLFEAIKTYVRKTGRKVMFEYLLIDGVNDTLEIAEELARLLIAQHPEGLDRPTGLYHVNLIKYHATDVSAAAALRFGLPVDAATGTGTFPSSPPARRKAFMAVLEERGISVTHRLTFGEDIDAACGQLANKSRS